MVDDRQARNDDTQMRVEPPWVGARTLSAAAIGAVVEGRQQDAEEHLADAKELVNGLIEEWVAGPAQDWPQTHAQAMAELIIAWQVVEEARPVVVPTDPSVR